MVRRRVRQPWRRCAAFGSVWTTASVPWTRWRVTWVRWSPRGIKDRPNCIRLVCRRPSSPFNSRIPAWPWEREEPAGPRRGRVCSVLPRCYRSTEQTASYCAAVKSAQRFVFMDKLVQCICVSLSVSSTEGPWATGEAQHRDAEDGGEAAGGEDGESEAGSWAREGEGLQQGERDHQALTVAVSWVSVMLFVFFAALRMGAFKLLDGSYENLKKVYFDLKNRVFHKGSQNVAI